MNIYYFDTVNTSIGALGVVMSERGLKRIIHADTIAEVKERLGKNYAKARLVHDPRRCDVVMLQIHAYLKGEITHFNVSLDMDGTPFQRVIWEQLYLLEYGSTITYSELAERCGKPMAVRAAGTACGANPLPLIIPCHRIVAKDGTLGGFAWGLKVKQQLLGLEKRASQKFTEAELVSVAA